MKYGLSPLQAKVLGISRIAIGFLFWVHGAQKLFGWFGGFGEAGTAELMSRFGAAGLIEFFGGLLIMLGLFTVPAAFIASGQMAVAYFWMSPSTPSSSFCWPLSAPARSRSTGRCVAGRRKGLPARAAG